MKKIFLVMLICMFVIGCSSKKEYIELEHNVDVVYEEEVIGNFLSSGALINSQDELDKYVSGKRFNDKSIIFFSGIYDGDYKVDITAVDLDNDYIENGYDGIIFVTAKKNKLDKKKSCNCFEVRGYLVELDKIYDCKKIVVELPEK